MKVLNYIVQLPVFVTKLICYSIVLGISKLYLPENVIQITSNIVLFKFQHSLMYQCDMICMVLGVSYRCPVMINNQYSEIFALQISSPPYFYRHIIKLLAYLLIQMVMTVHWTTINESLYIIYKVIETRDQKEQIDEKLILNSYH